jgi:hypothetical protein
MNFSFDNYGNFYAQHTSLSGRTPAPTNYPHNFYPHKPCSYCSNPYHNSSNCSSWGQLSNFSYEPLNINFSSPGFESNSNFYNSDWSNHFDFSWQAQATENYTPQYHELHHPKYCSITNLPIIRPTIIRYKNYHWKTHSKLSYKKAARMYKSFRVSP